MQILVTGSDGQIGTELVRVLQPIAKVIACPRSSIDLSLPDTVPDRLDGLNPDVIVNAAAYTAVDEAESREALAMRINAQSPAQMAAWAARNGSALVHFSTDYVYSGKNARPWLETDPAEPLSAYGRSKLAGDIAIQRSGAAHLILRTGWIYASHGRNFVRTILKLAREREELKVVNDQHGAPTWARCVAEATEKIIASCGASRAAVAATLKQRGGVFHATGAGETTWFDFARRVLDSVPDPERKLRRLLPITSEAYGAPAVRPAYSVLDNSRIRHVWGVEFPAWDKAIERCFAEVHVADFIAGA